MHIFEISNKKKFGSHAHGDSEKSVSGSAS